MLKLLLTLILLLLVPCGAWGDTHTAASCSLTDVDTALTAASNGDTVQLPGPCSVTWSSTLIIEKSITLKGGVGGTTTLGVGTNPIISIEEVATGARITGITFTSCKDPTIKVYTPYALIDNCTFTWSDSSQIIHVFDGTCRWDDDPSYGVQQLVYVENNTFNNSGSGGVSLWGNYNARMVYRYNKCNGCGIDMHGIWSNGGYWQQFDQPETHGIRYYEVYNNQFLELYSPGMQLRGGTGRVFDNQITTSYHDAIQLREYCVSANDYPSNNCYSTYQCPEDYPLRDQIGKGKGTGSNGIQPQQDEPLYFWGNTVNGSPLVGYRGPSEGGWENIRFAQQPTAAAVAYCGRDTGSLIGGVWVGGFDNVTGGETWSDMSAIIQENRDYYVSTTKPTSFIVGTGTQSYTPYQCPHSLATEYSGYTCDSTQRGRSGYPGTLGGDTTPPTLQSCTVSTNGTTATIVFNESVVMTDYDTGEFNLDCSTSGADINLSSPSGSGTSWSFTIADTIGAGEVCNIDFTGDANSIEDISSNDLATFSNTSVTNNSTVDITSPVVTITSPTSASTYSTSVSTITLAGSSSTDTSYVTYSIASGGNGNCTGTSSWTCSSISLASGSNVISVNAYDGSGNMGTDAINVTYTPPTNTGCVIPGNLR